MWISLGGSSMRASSSRHASSSFIVCAPGAPSSSFANEQKRHDATQTFVTSIRMFRLKYVRSPWSRSRTSLASWPTATTSGCRKSATPSSNESRSPARTFSAIASSVTWPPAACSGACATSTLARRRATKTARARLARRALRAPCASRPGPASRALFLPTPRARRRRWAARACSAMRPGELVGAEAERDLRELEPASRPVDAHARRARPGDARDGDLAQELEPRELLSPSGGARRRRRSPLGGARRCRCARRRPTSSRAHAVGERAEREQSALAQSAASVRAASTQSRARRARERRRRGPPRRSPGRRARSRRVPQRRSESRARGPR